MFGPINDNIVAITFFYFDCNQINQEFTQRNNIVFIIKTSPMNLKNYNLMPFLFVLFENNLNSLEYPLMLPVMITSADSCDSN